MGCYALLIFSGCCRKDRGKVRFLKWLWIMSSNSPAALYGSSWHLLPLISHFGGFTSVNTVWIGIMMMARIISDLCWALKGMIISLSIIIQFQFIPFFPTCQPKRTPISPSRRIVLEWEHAHGIAFLPPIMHLLRSSGPTKFNKRFRAKLLPTKETHQL